MSTIPCIPIDKDPSMRLLSAMTIVLFGLVLLAGPLVAGDPPGAAKTTPGQAQGTQQSGKGTIISIDASAGTIDFRITDDQGKNATTMVLTITATTTITKNKKTATVDNLKVGDSATFTFTSTIDPSAGTALTINALKPKGRSKKGAPAN